MAITVNAIIEFLNNGSVLFPNAIIPALRPDIEFNPRGSCPEGMIDVADIGTLFIPLRPGGERVAWIADGEQRSSPSRARIQKSPVPVVAFVSEEIEPDQEQFILVNKAKPRPTRLINELLPKGLG